MFEQLTPLSIALDPEVPHRHPAPLAIRPGYAMRLFARMGDVEVYEDRLRLSVEWGLTAQAEARSVP